MGRQVQRIALVKNLGQQIAGLGRLFDLSGQQPAYAFAMAGGANLLPESYDRADGRPPVVPYAALEAANGGRAEPPATPPPSPAAAAPAASARFDVGPLQRLAMKAMAGIWWVWNRAIDSRWDKLPPMLGVLYLYLNEQYLRLHVWDANALPSTDKTQYGPATEAQRKYRSADGTYMDDQMPGMGRAGARFNQLREPAGPPNPNFDKMDPNPMVLSERLMKRPRDAEGNPVIEEIEANSWFLKIQKQVHDWFNHDQQPITNRPVSFTIPKGHPLNPEGGIMVLNRTATDPTLPAEYKGPAVHRNAETSPWDMSDQYGSSAETQAKVRTFKGGHLKLGEDGYLPDDPDKPGVPLTGFNNNMSAPLAMQNIVGAREHNRLADEFYAEHLANWGIKLSDEELFQQARLRFTGVNARDHTIPWTRWLFAGSETLQQGMWRDWYGFLGKRPKLWVMRFSDRHPFLGKVLGKLLRYELIFGIPGTATQHYGKNYNFVEEFADVYRLHELIRDAYRVQNLQTNPDGTIEIRLMEPMKLRDMVGTKTQDALRAHSLEDWALTMGRERVGKLTINNFPDDLRNLTAQDGVKDGHKIDLAAIDIIRTRERLEASTYVKFTMRLGERPPRTFEELTGGDKEAAEKLRAAYKSVDQVDFQIGILAERKPVGFALGNRQFKVFVLSAPWRLKNDRFLSSQYDAKTYGGQSGIDYIETNNFSNILARAFPGLKRLDIEAMDNPYRPFGEPRWLQKTLLSAAQDSAAKLRRAEKISAVVNAVAGAGIGYLAWVGLVPVSMLALAGFLALAPWAFAQWGAYRRAAAVEGMRNVEAHAARAAERESLYHPLFAAEAEASRSSLLSKIGAILTMGLAGMIAFRLWVAAPPAAVILGGAAVVAGFLAWRQARAVKASFQLLRVRLSAELGEDAKHVDPAALPGETSIQKRYWFLLGDKKTPVASFGDSYAALRRSGLSAWKASGTTVLSHLLFSRKTQRNMTADEKARYSPGFFDIYVPNLIDAQGYSNTRAYASREEAAAKGMKAGDIDRTEFDRIFREFGALRGYVTAWDLARMREANAWRDAQEGRGNWLTRLFGRLAAKRRHDQLLELFADRVVWEDELHGKRVPAVSRDQLLRFYQGGAQYDLMKERKGAPLPAAQPPAPGASEMNLRQLSEISTVLKMDKAATAERTLSLEGLMGMSPENLQALYTRSEPGPIPDGDSAGRATFSPGSWWGRLWERILSLFWKGKVFDRRNGTLLNKVLGGRIVKAKVYLGPSKLDGKPAIIIDYGQTALLPVRLIRDEIRMVAPSLYLGYAYMGAGNSWVNVLPFALDFAQSAARQPAPAAK